jgi:hypothetical protein
MLRRAPWFVLLLMSLLHAGCGGGLKLAPVEGRVLVNGKPVNHILVTFVPDTTRNTLAPNSSGITDDDGYYQLICDDGGHRPGAVIGAHRITLIDLDNVKLPARAAAPRSLGPPLPVASNLRGGSKRRVPAEYGDWNQTTLKKQVEPGGDIINFDIVANALTRGR